MIFGCYKKENWFKMGLQTIDTQDDLRFCKFRMYCLHCLMQVCHFRQKYDFFFYEFLQFKKDSLLC